MPQGRQRREHHAAARVLLSLALLLAHLCASVDALVMPPHDADSGSWRALLSAARCGGPLLAACCSLRLCCARQEAPLFMMIR